MSLRQDHQRDDPLLDAARDRILAVGWKRTTLTDVARRAGVSRMTMYRRWPDMQTLLADLMTREWSTIAADSTLDHSFRSLEQLAAGVARTVAALRANDLFRRIVEVDPELLLPYLLDRRGRSQQAMLERLATAITAGQRAGALRDGDPVLLARAIMLVAYGFTLSAQTMTTDRQDQAASPAIGLEDLDDELRLVLQRYLAP